MIVIVDSGVANTGSIVNMLGRVGVQATVSSDPGVIDRGTKLILPGVGAFDAGMRSLDQRGLIPVLDRQVQERGIPILGLCLGMQLFTRKSEEGSLPGLGWLDADTVRFRPPASPDVKIPHMGWNTVDVRREHPVLDTSDEDTRFYFVHSYHVANASPDQVLGTTTHGYEFASVIGRDNILGVQFHPEKSHRFGMRLLRNFVEAA